MIRPLILGCAGIALMVPGLLIAQEVTGYSVTNTTQVMSGNFNLYSPTQVPGTNRFFLGGWGSDTRPAPLIDEIHRTENWGPITTVISKASSGKLVNDGTVARTPNGSLIMYYSQIDQSVIEAGGRGELTNDEVFGAHEVAYSVSSNNGSTWQNGGVLITPTQSGDGKGAWEPSAITVGSEVWLYYKTGSQNFSQPILFRQRLGSDGLTKIGSAQRLSISNWSSSLVANPDVKRVGDSYILAGSDFRPGEIKLYISDDGLSFEPLIKEGTSSNVLIDGTVNGGYVTSPYISPIDSDSFYVYYAQGPDDNNDNLGNEFHNIFRATVALATNEEVVVPAACTTNTLQASKNLSGYAWSSTVGWVSMSCENAGTCSTSDYGVSVYPNGDINGYAWSSNIGWISFFGGDTQGCPSGECQAKLNRSTGEVTGWARALAPMCSASAPQSGNWDGWIYLGQSSRVGVTADGCEWGGYAWGGGENTLNGVIGWLSFAGPGYSVIGSGDACATSGQGVDLTAGTPSKTGINGDRQVRFSAPIINNGNQAVNQPVGGRLQIALHSDNSTEFDINIDVAEFVQSVGANGSTTGTYTWDNPPSGRHQIRVCADHNNLIPESNEDNNCGPVLTFQVDNPGNGGGLSASCTGAPLTPNIGQEVTWTASVQGNVGQTTYTWTGTDGLSGTGNPITKRYTSEGPKTARLTVEAENATKLVDCSTTVSVGGGGGGNTPTVTFEADPNEVLPGGSTTLVWSAQNASSCTGTGFSTGGRTSGQVVVQNIEETSTYQIRCVQGQRQAVANETVRVLAPNLSITADGIDGSTRVPKNKVVTIEWSAEDIDSCNVTGPGINLQNLTDDPLSGSQSVTIDQRSVYTLECFAAGRRFTDAVVVNIPPDFEEF